MSNWHGILEIIEIQQIRDNKVIWSANNLKNTLHIGGEQFMLNILFSDVVKPDTYWFGLDNRSVIAVIDTLIDLDGEPTSHGYERQGVNSSSGWAFSTVGSQVAAKSPVVTFAASGGSIGPIRNLFMTNQAEPATPTETDYLISTVYLGQVITIADGDAISMRMVVKLKDCP